MAKLKKNLFIEDWLVAMLMKDTAGDKVKPGDKVSAAIYHFCASSDQDKKKMLTRYHDIHASLAYGLDNSVDPHSVAQRALTPPTIGSRKKGRPNHAG